MKTATEIETAITSRCTALGLGRPQAQALADAAPFPSDLVHILALDRDTLAPVPAKRWLWMAARTSSVSYRSVLTPDMLLGVLVSSKVPDEFQAHLRHFLDEADMQLVVMAIAQAAQQSGFPITHIWHNVAQLSRTLQSNRLRAVGEGMGLAQTN